MRKDISRILTTIGLSLVISAVQPFSGSNAEAAPTTKFRIHLKSASGDYISAEGNGGRNVNANGPAARNWETFTLEDINGNKLVSGDRVRIRTGNGNYFRAERGGGRGLRADRRRARGHETFTISSVRRGAFISHNDWVSLRSHNGHYMVAEDGGGGDVNANRKVARRWERFRLEFDFGRPINGVTRMQGEIPLVVALIAPDDPFWKPHISVVTKDRNSHIRVQNVAAPSGDMTSFALRLDNGRYVSAHPKTGEISVNATQARGWESFTVELHNEGGGSDGKLVNIKAKNGRYLVSDSVAPHRVSTAKVTKENATVFRLRNFTSENGYRHGDNISLSDENGLVVRVTANGLQVEDAGRATRFVIEQPVGYAGSVESLPDNFRFRSSPVITNTPDGKLAMVFAIASNGFVYQSIKTIYDDDWRPWWRLPGTTRFKEGPTVVNSPDGSRLMVFATGVDGQVYSTEYVRGNSGGWRRQWVTLGRGSRFSSAPFALYTKDGSHLELFVTDVNGGVHILELPSGNELDNTISWEKLPDATPMATAPSAFNTPDGALLSVMATGRDGHVHQILRRNSSQGWQNRWTPLPGETRLASAPYSTNSQDGRNAAVLALGTDGRLYKTVYLRDRHSRWFSDWAPLTNQTDLTGGVSAALRLAPRRRKTFYEKLFFDDTSGVRSYFNETSFGRFTYRRGVVTPWLTTVDDVSTELDESSFDYMHRFDERPGADERKSNWIVEQIEQLSNVRFRDYDANNDGRVTRDEVAIIWIYPGDTDARMRGFSPNLAPVPSLGNGGINLPGLPRAAARTSLETFAHELAHQTLMLDDLYADSSSDYPGVGQLSLMDAEGSRAHDRGWVKHIDPWAKIKLGWIEPVISPLGGRYSLAAAERSPHALIVPNPSRGTSEYFILENRWPSGRFGLGLREPGLAVWHITEPSDDTAVRGRDVIRLLSPSPDRPTTWERQRMVSELRIPPALTTTHSRWDDGSDSGLQLRKIPPAAPAISIKIETAR